MMLYNADDAIAFSDCRTFYYLVLYECVRVRAHISNAAAETNENSHAEINK